MHQAKRWVAAAALLLVAVPACTSTSAPSRPTAESKRDSGPSGPPKPRPAPSASEKGGFTFELPIGRYSYTENQRAVIESAKNSLTEGCMKEFGITYRSPRQNVTQNSSDRRYGISSTSEAARYGYHLPPDTRPKESPQGSIEFNVLYGQIKQHKGKDVPTNGCQGSSVAKLNEKFTNGEERDTAREISVVSYEKAKTDSRVAAATRSWSRCMSKLGFSYTSPLDALGDFPLEKPTPSPREIKTATADLECKLQTEFLETWFSVESEIQKRMIRENRPALQALLRDHTGNIRIAQSVISEGR